MLEEAKVYVCSRKGCAQLDAGKIVDFLEMVK